MPVRAGQLRARQQIRARFSRRRQENGLNKTCLKKAGQYGSRNPVSDCVRLILGDESPLELMPDMNMSMMIVMTVYSGASPDDVSELVTKPIEDRASTLSGLDTISSESRENMSIVMLKYEYGTEHE